MFLDRQTEDLGIDSILVYFYIIVQYLTIDECLKQFPQPAARCIIGHLSAGLFVLPRQGK